MKRIPSLILSAVLALAPVPAFAEPAVWTDITGARDSRAGACPDGTCDAPAEATDGVSLGRVGSPATLEIYVCADASQTITDGNGFDVYFYDAWVGLWAKYNSTPYTVPTGARCGYLQGDSPGKGIPMLGRRGRVAVVPNAAGASSGGLTIYLILSGGS